MTTDPVYFLLVDDLEENLLALEALLKRDGLTVLKAQSGSEALEVLLKHDVALALIDVHMPDMDGFELAALIRGTERTRRVPIIFLTAETDDLQRRFQGYEAGAVDFLNKPIEPDILKSKAEVFFQLYRQRQEVAHQRDELQAAKEENERLLQMSRQQAAKLQEADRRKDEFLAMLAHELRNPLTPIQYSIDIFRLADLDNPDLADALDIIHRQITHMTRLIDDLLDVARIARGKIELRSELCNFHDIVRQTSEDFLASMQEQGISLDIELNGEAAWVYGDQTRLAQIIGNLLHNASKFTEPGGVVSVKSAVDGDDQTVNLTVRDTGSGMDANVVESLFEPFSQGRQALDRTGGGLGLGLSLAKGLLDLHGGSIVAESDGEGKGSTFTVRLPLTSTANTTAQRDSDRSATRHSEKLRVVVVEDNCDTAKTTQLLLSLRGHQVDVAHDGQSGLEAARSALPDVVISDIGLPGKMNGYDLARKLRAEEALGDVYLIALSGYGQSSDQQRSREAGFDQHLVKPVDLPALEKALSCASQRKKLHQSR